jgi:hypothetical protein
MIFPSSSFGLGFGRKLLATAMVLTLGVTATSATVSNGDFESGLTSWTVQVPDAAATYFVGSPAHTGTKSFQVHFTPPSQGKELGVSARIISAPVAVQRNVPYKLTFWTYFDNASAGFIGVQLNGQPQYTIDATDHGWGGAFTLNTVNYTPTTDTVTITFEYLFGSINSLDRIDSVTFAPV